MATSRTGTAKWKRIRKAAIARAVEEGQDRCPQCGIMLDLAGTGEGAPVDVDHIIPWSKGGEDSMHNVAVLCITCNRSKGAGRGARGFRATRLAPPTRVEW